MPRNGCLTGARYAMICDIVSPDMAPPPEDADPAEGHWQWVQDPDSGAIIQEWVEDNPDTPDVLEGTVIRNVPLFAEGVLDGGIRVAGSTEQFRQVYEGIDWVKAVFPAGVNITKRDKVRNIREKRSGRVLWAEEEIFGRPPTLFNVNGVIPVIFMGKLVEQSVLLERAQVQ